MIAIMECETCEAETEHETHNSIHAATVYWHCTVCGATITRD